MQRITLILRQQISLILFAGALVLCISCSEGDSGSAADPDPEPMASIRSAADNSDSNVDAERPANTRTGDEVLAPELVGISGWVNTDPFTLESLRGKVVLIDIWTYTCINCIRTLPYIRDWYDKYADSGLVVIGVHSPEFEFEKDRGNVVSAVQNYGIEYPIVQDNDMATWSALDNLFWPAKYLIDRDGYIRYTHFGEGGYAETEEKIRELLEENGISVAGIQPNLEPERAIDPLAHLSTNVMKRQTRELYAGFARNYSVLQQGGAPYVRQTEYFSDPNIDIEYEIPVGEYINHHIYISGLWRNRMESLTHSRETENYEDYLVAMFFARTVNVVMGLDGEDSYEVRVTMDGMPLRESHAGMDIEFDDEGNSFVTVARSDMYRLVDLPEFGGHVLKISSNSSEFSVFAYTFGSYVD